MLVSLLSYHPGLLKAAYKVVSENSFLISATNLIMVTLGNGSMRSQVAALNFRIKGQVQLIFFLILGQQQQQLPISYNCNFMRVYQGIGKSLEMRQSKARLCFWDFSGEKRQRWLGLALSLI